jgi:mannose-6-phosphate isomerase-like protein (cupin superfamily)
MPAVVPGAGVSVFERFDPPLTGPPLHLRRHEDEILRVVEGRHRVRVGRDDLEVGHGGKRGVHPAVGRPCRTAG